MPRAALSRIQYACSACGATSPKWGGRCVDCGEWNAMVEEAVRPSGTGLRLMPEVPTPLREVVTDATGWQTTGMAEVDGVLGGGLVRGGLVLLGGDPGIGKSTLAFQLARALGRPDAPTLYCAGEESAAQLAVRAKRLGGLRSAIDVFQETSLGLLCSTIMARRPPLAVVDSVQTTCDSDTPGSPGSPSQVRQAVSRLMVCAKESGAAILLVGHVTKDGAIAGPRTLEHMVDVVLYLEGDRHGEHRILRGIKNRFGAAGEIGLFSITDGGMVELDSAARAWFDETSLAVPGSALTVTCEGSRALAVEVQALTIATAFGLPRRTASGFDLGRLHVLLAVLDKRGRVPLGSRDVYVNAVGGVRLAEPAADLAVALAVASAETNRRLPEGAVVLGEVGLAGEVRRVRRLEARLNEAVALGATSAIIPAAHAGIRQRGVECHPVARLTDALRILK